MPGFSFQGYTLETILLGGAVLLTLSVLASRLSSKFGVPSLLIFLGIGMLAGSEGPGGMRTSWRSIRPILPVGISLSLLGTLVTGVATGIFARFALGLSWNEGLLLGAIVSSTDAAAVFSILRARSLTLKGILKQTLEFEAGSNDPMAIFMTLGVLAFTTSNTGGTIGLGKMFLLQGGLGLALGYAGGKATRWLINHVGIEYEGLYGVLLLGLMAMLLAVTSTFKGSGFLAVYVAGLVIGNSEILHKGSISRFVDGIAWIAQILVFLTLGLLSFPSHLPPVWKEGILLSLFLMFIARPLSVLIAAPSAKIGSKERVFISWVGLRGAAPVILATLPWSVGFPKVEYFFNLVFFVVLTSVIAQGISIPWIAKKLAITVPYKQKPAHELSAGMLPTGFVTVEFEVKANAPSNNKRVLDLGLPAGVLLTSLEREDRYLVPHGDTVLAQGDRIWGLARPSNLETLRGIFGHARVIS